MDGRKVLTVPLEGSINEIKQLEINVPAGIYFVQLMQDGQRFLNGKLVISE